MKIKTSKYKNTRFFIDGEKFDSKHEYERWRDLQLLERVGEIRGLRRQVSYELAPSIVINGRRRPAIRYVADAVYFDKNGKEIVEDVKGFKTAVYRIKQHLLALKGIYIMEVKR